MLNYINVLIYIEAMLLVGLAAFRTLLAPAFRDVVSPKIAVLTLATPAVALTCGNLYVFYGYLACAVGLTARDRRELCGIYLAMLPMMPALHYDVFAGSVYLLNMSSFVAMNIGALIGLLLTRPVTRRSDPALDAGALLLTAVFAFIEVRGAESLTVVLRGILQNAVIMLPPYLLASRSAADAGDLRRAYLHLCLAAFMGSILSVFIALKHWEIQDMYYSALHLDKQFMWGLILRGGRMRAGGTMADFSTFGLFMAAVIVVLPGLRGAFRPAGYRIAAAVLLLGLFNTQSRGAWVGLFVGYLVSLGLRGRTTAAVSTAVVAIAGYFLVGSWLVDLLGMGGSDSTGNVEYRQRLLSRGLELVAAHPMSGMSVASVVSALPDMVQGQGIVDFVNTPLYVAMTAGIPLLLLSALAWTGPVVRVALAGKIRLAPGSVAILTAPAAVIVVSVTSMYFTSTIDRNLFWPMLALGFATPLLVPRNARGRRSVERVPSAPVIPAGPGSPVPA